jgi:uncharacterized protein
MTDSAVDRADVIRKTEAHIRELLAQDSSGHDWWHIHRVRSSALAIGRREGADLFVVELAALLHDVADWKFHGGDENVGPQRAVEWLNSLGVDQQTADRVGQIVSEVTFKGAGVATRPSTLEGCVVQDADRLDAVGAIGIARAFAYGGHAGRAIHDPTVSPEEHASFAAYKSSKGPTINHFYEKLLLLKDRMNTETGRALAAERHRVMEEFLAEFFAEWEGSK